MTDSIRQFRARVNQIGTEQVLLGGIFLLAFALRIGFVFFKPPVLVDIDVQRQTDLVQETGISASTIELVRRGDLLQSDDVIYDRLGTNIAAGNGVSEDLSAPFRPTRIRTPGYPMFLAAVYTIAGPNFKAALFVQSLLGSLTCLLVYGIARRVAGSGAGLTAALIVACYPALIYYDTRLLRESLIAFLIAFSVWWNVRSELDTSGDLWVTGFLISWLSMIKPEMILLGLPLVGFRLLRLPAWRSRAKCALLVSIPVVLVWLPWTARNIHYFGSPSPVTLGLGSVVWFGNRWADIGGEDRKREDQWDLRREARGIISDTTSETETKAESVFADRAVEDLTGRPDWFLKMTLKKAYLFWKDANGTKKTLPALHPLLPGFVNTAYYALLLSGLIGLTWSCRRSDRARLVAATVATFALTYALLHVRNRYRVPILPLVFVFSAVGLSTVAAVLRTCAVSIFSGSPSDDRVVPMTVGTLSSTPVRTPADTV